jgi:hypothetical protein
LYNERKKLIARKQNILNDHSRDTIHILEEVAKLNKIEVEIEHLTHLMKLFENACSKHLSDKFAGIAFVTFERQEHVELIETHFYRPTLLRILITLSNFLSCGVIRRLGCFDRFLFAGEMINVIKAPEPTDIEWNNLGTIGISHRVVRLFKTIIGIILLMAMNYVVYLVMVYETETHKKSLLLVLGCSALISLINLLASVFVQTFSLLERFTTFTYETNSKIIKFLSYTLFNSVFVPICAFQIRLRKAASSEAEIQTAEVFALNVLFLILIWGGLQFVLNFVSIELLAKLYHRRKILNAGKRSTYTQGEANKYFEGPEFALADKFTTAVTLLFVSLFFAMLFPLGLPIAALLILVLYWQDKILLLRWHALPRSVSEDIMKSIMRFMLFCPVCFSIASSIINNNLDYDEISQYPQQFVDVGNIIAILVFVYYSFSILDTKSLRPQRRGDGRAEEDPHKSEVSDSESVGHASDSSTHDPKYDDVRVHFLWEYDRENPMTSAQGFLDWWEFLERQQKGVDAEGEEKAEDMSEYEMKSVVPPLEGEISMFKGLENYAERNYCGNRPIREELEYRERTSSHPVFTWRGGPNAAVNISARRGYSIDITAMELREKSSRLHNQSSNGKSGANL